jgi:hypothetical protein
VTSCDEERAVLIEEMQRGGVIAGERQRPMRQPRKHCGNWSRLVAEQEEHRLGDQAGFFGELAGRCLQS